MNALPHHAHWPKELPYSLDYPEAGVADILAGSARRFGDRSAFHFAGRDLSYTQLWRQACQFAHALGNAGVRPGDVVAVHMPNCPQYPVAYYGTLLAGATFSPANPLLPPGDLAFQLADCAAVAVVTYGDAARAVAAVRDKTQVRLAIVTDGEQGADPSKRVDTSALGDIAADFEDFCADQPAEPPQVTVDARQDLAHLAYTGGTTGRSKGVRLPHRNVVVNSLQYACWGGGAVPERDEHGGVTLRKVAADEEFPIPFGTGVAVNLTPWFHAMGTIGALNVPVLGGNTTVIHQRFDAGEYLADAERFRVTSIGGAPPIFVALLSRPEIHTRDLSAVRTISSGAAPLARELITSLQQRFPEAVVAEGYGLTEATMGATLSPANQSGQRKVGSVGIPVFDTEVKVVPPEGGEDPLPAGSEGEVCLRGPQVMAGYHNSPDDTAEVLVDGWLHTGDVGVLDEDGFLSIVDRKKDMLIYKGYNVYPRELEEILFAHPAVGNAAVIGRPDESAGELPVAVVVRAGGHEGVTADDLMAAVNDRVLPYKRLREVRFVDEIPVSSAGKVLKRELRRQLAYSQ